MHITPRHVLSSKCQSLEKQRVTHARLACRSWRCDHCKLPEGAFCTAVRFAQCPHLPRVYQQLNAQLVAGPLLPHAVLRNPCQWVCLSASWQQAQGPFGLPVHQHLYCLRLSKLGCRGCLFELPELQQQHLPAQAQAAAPQQAHTRYITTTCWLGAVGRSGVQALQTSASRADRNA